MKELEGYAGIVTGASSGIGLAIATSAAERMKGSVKGENRPEGGAVFTLTLQRSS